MKKKTVWSLGVVLIGFSLIGSRCDDQSGLRVDSTASSQQDQQVVQNGSGSNTSVSSQSEGDSGSQGGASPGGSGDGVTPPTSGGTPIDCAAMATVALGAIDSVCGSSYEEASTTGPREFKVTRTDGTMPPGEIGACRLNFGARDTAEERRQNITLADATLEIVKFDSGPNAKQEYDFWLQHHQNLYDFQAHPPRMPAGMPQPVPVDPSTIKAPEPVSSVGEEAFLVYYRTEVTKMYAHKGSYFLRILLINPIINPVGVSTAPTGDCTSVKIKEWMAATADKLSL